MSYCSERRIRAGARKAISLLRRDGWCQRSKGRGRNGERCAMVAILDADREAATAVRSRAEILLHNERKVDMFASRARLKPLARWNDRKGRTVDEVIDLLKRVARGERGRL